MVACWNRTTRIVVACGLMGFGLLMFAGPGLLWPLFILVPGVLLLIPAFTGGATGAAVFAIPGMLVAGTGALLLWQNITGYWSSWAYAWTLYGVFLGMAFMLMGQKLPSRELHAVGRGFVQVSLAIFTVLALFLELVLGLSGFGGTTGAIMLILLGTALLLWNERQDSLGPGGAKAKHKRKFKRHEDKLFAGPIIVGTQGRLSRGDAPGGEHTNDHSAGCC